MLKPSPFLVNIVYFMLLAGPCKKYHRSIRKSFFFFYIHTLNIWRLQNWCDKHQLKSFISVTFFTDVTVQVTKKSNCQYIHPRNWKYDFKCQKFTIQKANNVGKKTNTVFSPNEGNRNRCLVWGCVLTSGGKNRLVNSNLKKQPTFRTSNMCNPALLLNSVSTSPNYVLSPLKYTVCAVTWLFCDSPVCDMKTSWRKCQTLSQLRSLYQIKMGCFFCCYLDATLVLVKTTSTKAKGTKKECEKIRPYISLFQHLEYK